MLQICKFYRFASLGVLRFMYTILGFMLRDQKFMTKEEEKLTDALIFLKARKVIAI